MNFYQFIKREGDFKTRVVIINCLSGIISIILASVIVSGANDVQPGEIQVSLIMMFFACLISYYITRHYAHVKISRHAESVINETRKRISNKIRNTNLLNFEGIGKEYFYTTLTTDSQTISQSSIQIINATGALVMVAAGCVALFIISPITFAMSAIIFVAIIILYAKIRKSLRVDLEVISKKENEFFGMLNDLLFGFKELKLNTEKSDDFINNDLHKLADEVFEIKANSAKQISKAIILSQIYMYIILGAVVFILPNLSPGETSTVSPTSALLLFITGPLIEVVTMLSVMDRVNNSIKNLVDIEATLDRFNAQKAEIENTPKARRTKATFDSLKCENAVFSYHEINSDTSFTLGPIDFELKRNEIVFIVGGNGSGKSTFLKAFTTLYAFESGQLYLDGKPLTPSRVQTYRNLISPIFVDFHLFGKIYGQKEIDYNKADEVFEEMQLSDVTDIVDGKVTKRDLSTGQRKRLALAISILEDKEIFLFDEVAADQDPVFRKYFYETIIPKLKASGKTVLAVTHDDKYFGAADRVLKMNNGKFIPFEA